MHKINKGEPSEDFKQFNRKKHTRWEEAKGHTHIWREHIIQQEQHGCSGYTEVPIRTTNSHIDHFRKQALFQDYIFCWENYVADSIDEDFGAKFKDKTIHTKEENLKLINPIEENAERFFYYLANGMMVPALGLTEQERERAQFTIDMFNLNHQSLKERRKLILNIDLAPYIGCSREDLIVCLSSNGFKSVVEQTVTDYFELKEEQKNDEP